MLIDNISLKDKNIYLTETPTIPAPKRQVNTVIVEGRDGELTIDRGRYENIEIMLYGHALDQKRSQIVSFFKNGKKLKLEDDQDKFYLYKIKHIDTKTVLPNKVLQFSVLMSLEAIPYTDQGQQVITSNNNLISLNNDTDYPAYPKYRIKTTGDLAIKVNDKQTLSISDVEEYVELDAKLDIIHKGVYNKEADSVGEIPVLEPNTRYTIELEPETARLEIIPRWRTL